eukprot:GHUV01039396.1.p1 GENE.GHUV01039396.1~~GHUV01039396.1.p1  ORF type:complete len:194 (+),score=27.77 GHUV01039396.1:227-808(+)
MFIAGSMLASSHSAVSNPLIGSVSTLLRALSLCNGPAACSGASTTTAFSQGSVRHINSGHHDVDDKLGRPTTPWVRQVISGVDLMRHPKYNKGLAFSDSERDRLYLRGLLPPAVLSQEVQLERAILNIRSKADPLDKYNYLSSLQGRNERLFYRCAVHWPAAICSAPTADCGASSAFASKWGPSLCRAPTSHA